MVGGKFQISQEVHKFHGRSGAFLFLTFLIVFWSFALDTDSQLIMGLAVSLCVDSGSFHHVLDQKNSSCIPKDCYQHFSHWISNFGFYSVLSSVNFDIILWHINLGIQRCDHFVSPVKIRQITSSNFLVCKYDVLSKITSEVRTYKAVFIMIL